MTMSPDDRVFMSVIYPLGGLAPTLFMMHISDHMVTRSASFSFLVSDKLLFAKREYDTLVLLKNSKVQFSSGLP